MTWAVKKTHAGQHVQFFVADQAQIDATRGDLAHLLHACRGGFSLRDGHGGEHRLDTSSRDGRSRRLTLDGGGIVTVSPDLGASATNKLG